MSTFESLREDARCDRYDDETYCLSNDSYCSRNSMSSGTYEAYAGSLCGECEDEQEALANYDRVERDQERRNNGE